MGKRNTKRPLRRGKPSPGPTAEEPSPILRETQSISAVSISPASVEPEPPSSFVNSSKNPDVAVEQDEDELLPGVEYDIVVTAPPRESVSCMGIIVSISERRTGPPLSDSEWDGMIIGEDED